MYCYQNFLVMYDDIIIIAQLLYTDQFNDMFPYIIRN